MPAARRDGPRRVAAFSARSATPGRSLFLRDKDAQIEEGKDSTKAMKYFTPELYLRFNARDRAVVARAHEEWESAIEKYQKHLAQIRPRLRPNLRRLAKTLCLHDASYLGLGRPKIPRLHHSLAVLAAQKNSTVYLLVYMLAQEPHVHEPKGNWPFSKKDVHWLYDEFDVERNGNLRHEVLLSDGRRITFQFKDMQLIVDRGDVDRNVA